MKKFLSVLASIAVLGTMTCGVFAAGPAAGSDEDKDLSDSNKTTVIDVTAKLTHGAKVYNVDVEWTSMEFVYTLGTWDPDDHVYDNGSWAPASATIDVTNHSNAEVNVKVTQEDKGDDGLSINLTGDATAADGKTLKDGSIVGIYATPENADTTQVTVTPVIDLKSKNLPAVDTTVTIAQITVTLAKVTA